MRDLLKPLQVYLVEDSTIIRQLLASTISAVGAELIGQSADAQQAIKDLSVLSADLVIVDIALKSGTGFDVLEALQKLDRKPAPIKVVLTNHVGEEYRCMSLRLGANGFFDKGTETSQVLALISALASEKKTRWTAAALAPSRRDAESNKPACVERRQR